MGSYAASPPVRVLRESPGGKQGRQPVHAVLHRLGSEKPKSSQSARCSGIPGEKESGRHFSRIMDEAKREGAFASCFRCGHANDRAIHVIKTPGCQAGGVISDYYTRNATGREDALFMEAMLTHA